VSGAISYPACKAHTLLYCHLWLVWLFHIFPHCLINSMMISCTTFVEKFLILRRIERDTIANVHSLHVKCLLFMSYFNEIWIFVTDFIKILRNQISRNFVQWEVSCSMWIDRRTNRHVTKLVVTFYNFANVLRNLKTN
jgi:hypothetical protein